MQYRCHECGELFESSHTSYKFAKGFHPSDNPAASADVAKDFDHCTNCRAIREHDPVAARTRDLAQSGGPDSGIVSDLQVQVARLTAQVEKAKTDRALAQTLQEQVANLSKQLSTLAPSSGFSVVR